MASDFGQSETRRRSMMLAEIAHRDGGFIPPSVPAFPFRDEHVRKRRKANSRPSRQRGYIQMRLARRHRRSSLAIKAASLSAGLVKINNRNIE